MNKETTKEMKKKKILFVDIGVRLRNHRLHLNMTQEKMAEVLEMSLNYYGQIERGESCLSIEKLILLYQKHAIDICYLLTGDTTSVNSTNELLTTCPQNKRLDFERLIHYAHRLSQN